MATFPDARNFTARKEIGIDSMKDGSPFGAMMAHEEHFYQPFESTITEHCDARPANAMSSPRQRKGR